MSGEVFTGMVSVVGGRRAAWACRKGGVYSLGLKANITNLV